MLELDVSIESADPVKVVEEADLLVTATTVEVGSRPLFEKQATKPYLHINAVGSDFPGKIELPLDLLKKSIICPDFTEQAKLEGECQSLEPDEIGPDWVKIIQNPAQYHHLKSKLTVFDSTGWPLEDLVLMDLLLEYADTLGLGSALDLELISNDAKNPYHFMKHSVPEIVVNKSKSAG
jgi:ornithine cyclodeaminase/alanine dehydrogenase-like protein (mu-crystallin family)